MKKQKKLVAPGFPSRFIAATFSGFKNFAPPCPSWNSSRGTETGTCATLNVVNKGMQRQPNMLKLDVEHASRQDKLNSSYTRIWTNNIGPVNHLSWCRQVARNSLNFWVSTTSDKTPLRRAASTTYNVVPGVRPVTLFSTVYTSFNSAKVLGSSQVGPRGSCTTVEGASLGARLSGMQLLSNLRSSFQKSAWILLYEDAFTNFKLNLSLTKCSLRKFNWILLNSEVTVRNYEISIYYP